MTPPLYRMAITNAAGDYYYAEQDSDGNWTVNTTSTATYLQNLPKGWDNHKIGYRRNMEWMGVFRSLTSDLIFSDDGYGIMYDMYHNNGWIQSELYITIEKRIDTESTGGAMDFWRYETYYSSMVNFNDISFDHESVTVRVGVLDGELNDLIKANAGTQFNIPIWVWDGASWSTNAVFLEHQGIKLLWQADWESAATTTNPLVFGITNPVAGFNLGQTGTGANAGMHTLVAMTQKTIIQNNGATTFIGNDILNEFILTGNQQALQYPAGNNDTFDNFTSNSFTIKQLLRDNSGGVSIELGVSVAIEFEGNVVNIQDTLVRAGYTNLKVVLFEVDENDEVPIWTVGPSSGLIYIDITGGLIPGSIAPAVTSVTAPPFDNYLTPTQVTFNYNKVYVLSIIYDDFTNGINPALHTSTFNVTKLIMRVTSAYNSGASAPIDAPRFPASPVAGFRPETLWETLVPCLETNSTDAYGFPVVSPTPKYTGKADGLLDYTDYSVVANDVIVTSGNNLRLINGQPYITTSIRDFFQFCKVHFSMGMAIEANQLIIYPLNELFNSAVEILDLGTDVSKLKIYPFSDVAINNLKIGYDKISTNNDFGVDGFCTEQHYRTNVTREIRDLDAKCPYNAEMYAIEKARAQKNTQAIQSPSSDNQTFIIQVAPSPDGTFDVYDPSGTLVTGVDKYVPLVYPTAQSTDSTAASDPYVRGLYYPDTAINLPLSPSRSLWRFGKYLHTATHGQDGKNLQFQKQYQMLYDNSSVPLPGISTNLQDGYDEIQEIADVPVSQLPDKLFIPTILEVITTYPVNMHSIIDAGPYGYIKFNYRGKEYKGFIYEVQIDAIKAATTFKLLATPDMTF